MGRLTTPTPKGISDRGPSKKAPKPRNVAASMRSGYESVSVRRIDNGFLICHSTDKGYSEVYSPTKPKIEVPAKKR